MVIVIIIRDAVDYFNDINDSSKIIFIITIRKKNETDIYDDNRNYYAK